MAKRLDRTEVLLFMESTGKKYTVSDLVQEFDSNRGSMSKLLARLVSKGFVTKSWYKGRSGYKAREFKQPLGTKLPDTSLNEVFELAHYWSQQKWDPKIFQTVPNLPSIVARMIEKVVELSEGQKEDPDEIERLKLELNSILNSVLQLGQVLQGIQKLGELWDLTSFAEFLMDKRTVVQLKELAQGIRVRNGTH